VTKWSKRRTRTALSCVIGLAATSGLLATVHTGSASAAPGRQIEQLDRGLVAVPTPTGVLVSWRQFADEVGQTSWHIYRNGRRITPTTIADRTNFLDTAGTRADRYSITPVTAAGVIGARSAEVQTWANPYLDIPLNKPAGGSTASGAFDYRANDASVGDLDGDGQYEVIVKWDPSNQQDNSKPGHTGEVFLDAYKMNGTRLWRIGMGRNIRAGAHYTQFLVYDFDGDGKSEIVAKTADGTRDGRGTVIGNATVDHRNSTGYILTGPEFLTVFDGLTGAIRVTTNYDPPRGDMCLWGDCWGNRGDRFLAAVAYLDGRPSIVMARGYYTRTVLVAYDFRDGRLTKRWTFDTNVAGRQYEGAGNHNLAVADVDGDGRDEIVYGSLTIDDNGRLLYATGLKHGDALHVGDLNPARPGLEVFSTHEQSTSAYGMEMHDARTGQIILGQRTGKDTGRGAAGDIDPRHPGAESWAVDGEWNSPTGWMFNAAGRLINTRIPAANNLVWWDGDLTREILDHNYNATTQSGVGTIGKWDPVNSRTVNLLTATGTLSNNTTKGNPSLQADLLGDWREEVLWRTQDSTALRLYATPHASPHAFPTLMHDPVYRLGVAWQNVGYNQPPHTSYYLGTR